MNKINKAGFTLLELLVVIGIIGVMMAFVTVAYSSTQKSGRDARRKQDLIAIQNALEQYYSASGFKYPDGACNTAEVRSNLKSNWPVDPGTSMDYGGIDICSSSTNPNYCICALMEVVTSGNSGSNCNWNGGKDYYCVGNLQ
jgi:prepilin-type N-terminal cleavage/methylation domain-containing protein